MASYPIYSKLVLTAVALTLCISCVNSPSSIDPLEEGVFYFDCYAKPGQKTVFKHSASEPVSYIKGEIRLNTPRQGLFSGARIEVSLLDADETSGIASRVYSLGSGVVGDSKSLSVVDDQPGTVAASFSVVEEDYRRLREERTSIRETVPFSIEVDDRGNATSVIKDTRVTIPLGETTDLSMLTVSCSAAWGEISIQELRLKE